MTQRVDRSGYVLGSAASLWVSYKVQKGKVSKRIEDMFKTKFLL